MPITKTEEIVQFCKKLLEKDHVQVLGDLHRWVQNREPFIHTRLNDGEFICMFENRGPQDKNCCGHHYFPDLGKKLIAMLVDIARVYEGRLPGWDHIQLSSYWIQDLDHCTASNAVRHFLDLGVLDTVPWVGDNQVLLGIQDESTYRLIDAIRAARNRVKHTPIVLVANPGLVDAAKCLGATFYSIPRFDCWLATEKVLRDLDYYAQQGGIFIWCASMCKSWAWDLFCKHPQSSHVDFGHMFDGVFGDYSRNWLRRKDSPLWEVYRDRFTPYVKSFI